MPVKGLIKAPPTAPTPAEAFKATLGRNLAMAFPTWSYQGCLSPRNNSIFNSGVHPKS